MAPFKVKAECTSSYFVPGSVLSEARDGSSPEFGFQPAFLWFRYGPLETTACGGG